MTRLALAVLALCVLTLGAKAQHAADANPGLDLMPGIVGEDNRAILWDETAFQAVGRLNLAGAGFCTATLIAPDVVATAAHCLFYTRTGAPVPPDKIHFLAGYRKGAYIAHRQGVAVATHPDYGPHGATDTRSIAADVAIVWLSEPIEGDLVTPIPVAQTLRPGDRLLAVSYARDRAELPSIERDCAAIGVEQGVLLSTCDVNFGGSGGPLMVDEGGAPALAAVVSGAGRIDTLRVSFGAPAPAALAKGLFR